MNEPDSNACPKCGAPAKDGIFHGTRYSCGSHTIVTAPLESSIECLQRQIDQLRTAYLELRLECSQAINASGPRPEGP